MSFKASAWAVDQKVGNSTAKLLLLTLAEAASIEDASCFPSRSKLADRIEASVDTVDRALRLLVEAGFITVTKRQRQNGSDSSNVYTINLDREPQNAASRTAMRPSQPQGYAAPPSRTAMRPPLTGQSETSVEQVNSCRVGNSTSQTPSFPDLPQEPGGETLEANPEAEPKGQGEETPHVPRPPLTAPDKYADARKVLAHLNASTGRNFRETDSNLKLIRGRLLEAGVDVGGCLQMIDRQCAKWLKDPKMAEYLRPETLFGKLKFDSYYSARSLPVVLEAPKVHSQKPPTRWDLEKEQARLEEALKKHKGNDNSMVYVHEWATPEQIEDANRLKARLKDVKSKLLHFPSGE